MSCEGLSLHVDVHIVQVEQHVDGAANEMSAAQHGAGGLKNARMGALQDTAPGPLLLQPCCSR